MRAEGVKCDDDVYQNVASDVIILMLSRKTSKAMTSYGLVIGRVVGLDTWVSVTYMLLHRRLRVHILTLIVKRIGWLLERLLPLNSVDTSLLLRRTFFLLLFTGPDLSSPLIEPRISLPQTRLTVQLRTDILCHSQLSPPLVFLS